MARTTINKTTLLGPYPALPLVADSADLNLQASSGASGSNGNQVAWGDFGRMLIVAQNTDASARTVLISSIANAAVHNRSGDLGAYSIGAGEIAVFEVKRPGFYQADAMLYLETNNALVKLAAIGIG